jgi:glycosyltransferase involved in cell wall biosynthesis
MRLAILMNIGSPWARDVATHLSAAGVEVHAIDFGDAEAGGYISSGDAFQSGEVRALNETLAGVHLLSAGGGSARHFRAVPEFRRLLRRLKPDRLLTLYGGGFANLAWLSGFRPYVVYVVGSDVLLVAGLRKLLAVRALRAAALVVANGEYLASRARDLDPSLRVEPLYLTVDTDLFKPAAPANGRRIICTRGFLPVYNNAYLIDGLAAMGDRVPSDVTVTFVAPGPDLTEVSTMADSLLAPEVRRRVRFLNGLGRTELVKELQQSDVYVSLSRSDGTSLSLLEALATGIFPVLSDLPQNREWVTEEERNGVLVPFDQPPVLADALRRSLDDAEWRAAAGRINRRKVIERASPRRNTEALMRMLETAQ